MKASELTDLIKIWAMDRGLDVADPNKQMLKLMEEVGELAQGMAKNNASQIIDSVGDVYVVLTILSMQIDLDIEDCIEQAYVEIADRKGKMINGVFVKEEDLQ
ncbi:MazG-like family protein [Oceanobacillus sp. FSL W7-1293]|uniref:MazG-like family protein n=1 Tax=Oceanobacillus sp. FSL W7-1293 TaxID=2921699 RepID=UPI0030CCFA6E